MMRIRVLEAIPYAWVVVTLCVVINMALSFTNGGLGVLFPFIQEDLSLSLAELGFIASGSVVGGAASALLGGWLSDVLGVRRMQALALTGVVVGLFFFSLVQSLAQGILLAVLIGISFQVTQPAIGKAIMDWVTPQTRGMTMGITEASIPIGGIIAAVLLTFLALAFNWQWAVRFLALMTLVSGMLFVAFYRDRPHTSYPEGQKRSGLKGMVGLVARNRDIWVVAFYGAAFSGIQVALVSYIVLFLREELEMSAELAGAVLAVFMAGGVAGRVGWGLVSDQLLSGRRVVLLAIVGVLTAVSIAFIAWLPSDAALAVVLVLVFVVGSTALGRSGVQVVLLGELAGPALTGTAIGFSTTIGRLGTFGIPPAFGLIVDKTGSYDMAWWMIVGLASVGTLMLAFLRPEGRRR